MFDKPGFGRSDEANDAVLPLLSHVVYCSLATAGIDDADVRRIVASSQRHNLARNITGVLVFSGGVFLQWIEGPRVQIQRLMAILYRDSRHHDIVTLSETEEKRERLYPDWDMKQVADDDLREVLRDALDKADDANNAAALKRIIAHLDSGPMRSLGRE